VTNGGRSMFSVLSTRVRDVRWPVLSLLAALSTTPLVSCSSSNSAPPPAPDAGVGVAPTNPAGVIVSLGSAISSGIRQQEMIDELEKINSQLSDLQKELENLQSNIQSDFFDLLLQNDQDTYTTAVQTLQDTWVSPIVGAFNTLVDIAETGSQSTPNIQLLNDQIADFHQYVESNKLDEAGNAIQQALLSSGPSSGQSIWGLGWNLARSAQGQNYNTNLYTSNLSGQFQALTQGWVAIMSKLELVLVNYYNDQASKGQPPTQASMASAQDEVTASEILTQVSALETANPKAIPDNVLVDPSTNLMWAYFGQLPGVNASLPTPPQSTNSAGEQTGLGDLLDQINGTKTVSQAGWSNFPAGVAGQGSGPSGSGLQISNWAFANMNFESLQGGNDMAFNDEGGVQFGGYQAASGLMSQLSNPGAGDAMEAAMSKVSTPPVFPYGENTGDCMWTHEFVAVWVYSGNAPNFPYQSMVLTAETYNGDQSSGTVGAPISQQGPGGDLQGCSTNIVLKTPTTASDYAWGS
jgi:hypothetical protein